MKKPIDNEVFIRFSPPDPITSIVNVTRTLSDGTEESIGLVYPIFNNESDSVNYVSLNNSGEEIFPPTSDFVEIENRFLKSIRHRSDITDRQNIEATLEEFENRKKTVRHLRQVKARTSTRIINR